MSINTSIRAATIGKPMQGASVVTQYSNLMWHEGRGDWIIAGVASGGCAFGAMADLSAPCIEALASPIASIASSGLQEDHVNGGLVIFTGLSTTRYLDSDLDNPVTAGSLWPGNIKAHFSRPGDSTHYAVVAKNVYSTTDRWVTRTTEEKIMNTSAPNMCTLTPGGSFVVLATSTEVVSCDLTNNPKLAASWDLQLHGMIGSVTALGVNHAEDKVLIGTDNSDIAIYTPGAAPTIIAPVDNWMINASGVGANPTIGTIIYSSVHSGFVIIGTNGRMGFLPDGASVIQGIYHYTKRPITAFATRLQNGWESSAGEICWGVNSLTYSDGILCLVPLTEL